MQDGGYNPIHFEVLAGVEDRHFWFRARNRVITALVQQVVAERPGMLVLEVGCGTGNVLRFLERTCGKATVVGMDLFGEGLRIARQRTSCPLVQGDICAPPFARPFDLVGIFDVLEHLADDVRVLRDLHKLLALNGILLITVPACKSLWSYFDEASQHCRRYEQAELTDKLLAAGFRVDFLSHFMTALFPFMWLTRKLPAKHAGPASEPYRAHREFRIIPLVNGLFTQLLRPEARWLVRRRRLPVGTSLVAIARKC